MLRVVAPAVVIALSMSCLSEQGTELVDEAALGLHLSPLGQGVGTSHPAHEVVANQLLQRGPQNLLVAVQKATKVGDGSLLGEALTKQPEHDLQYLVLPVESIEG